jgi:hypothetical protein
MMTKIKGETFPQKRIDFPIKINAKNREIRVIF